MLQDIKFGLKLLLKHRAFTTAALLTLALCIGANTAIFTVLDHVVLRGLPYPQSDRLVAVYNLYPGVGVSDGGSNSAPDYPDRRKLTDVFKDVAMIGFNGYDIGLEGSPQRIDGQKVTPSFFQLLGIQPLKGRAFTEDEGTTGKDKVAVLSAGLWNDMFARDPNVLDKDIRLSGVPYRIVGVMPEGFGIFGRDTRVWTPLVFTQEQLSDDSRHSNNWAMIARLQPGVSPAFAQQRIDGLNKQIGERFPKLQPLLENARFYTRVVGLKDEMVRSIRPTLYLLQAAVGVVLLIGCVNLANLMLVRSSVRMKELSVRFSLGASRWRLARQLVTESVTLALIGGGLGVAIAFGGVRLLSNLGAQELPRGESIGIDTGILAFTAGVAVLTGLIFGSFPLLQVFKRDLNEVFRGDERTGTMSRRAMWVRSVLVVSQVSLAFVLLIGSGLLTLSFARLLEVDPGFRAENVMTARFSLPNSRYKDDAAVRNATTALLDRIRSLPGVRNAGFTTFLPFGGSSNASVMSIEGYTLGPGENPPVPGWNNVDSGYLGTMGIPLIQGRNFAETDTETSQPVALVDEFLARKYWPRGNAIGARVWQGLRDEGPVQRRENVLTIVGIVGGVNIGNLSEQRRVGQIYRYYKQSPYRSAHLVVKGVADSVQLTSAVRRELAQLDAELPLFDIKTMPQRISASLVERRAAMILCLIFGGLALLLAAVGVYGVLAYSVEQRTREFGIRMALGARARDVLGMVAGLGVRLAAAGLVIGAAAAFAVTRLMTTLLYGVKPTDPIVFAAVASVLAAVTILSALIPSFRAVRIRPADALRHQ